MTTPRLTKALLTTLPANHPVIDVECGKGERIKTLKSNGFKVTGYDSREFSEGQFSQVKRANPIKTLPKGAPEGSYLCLGLIDRVKPSTSAILISNLTRKCRRKLIFTWDKRGAFGRDSIYVIREMEKKGFQINLPETNLLRDIVRADVAEYATSLYVFDRVGV